MKPRVRVKAGSRRVAQVVKFQRKPNADIAGMLAQFLERNEAGVLDGLAVAATWHDGTVSTAYTLGSENFKMLGCVEHLSARVRNGIGD